MIVLSQLWQGTGPMLLFEKEVSAAETLRVTGPLSGRSHVPIKKRRSP
jgi:hypothetical protein